MTKAIKDLVMSELGRGHLTTPTLTAHKLGLNPKTVAKCRDELIEENRIRVIRTSGRYTAYAVNDDVTYWIVDDKAVVRSIDDNVFYYSIEIQQSQLDSGLSGLNRFKQTVQLNLSKELINKIKSIDFESDVPFFDDGSGDDVPF